MWTQRRRGQCQNSCFTSIRCERILWYRIHFRFYVHKCQSMNTIRKVQINVISQFNCFVLIMLLQIIVFGRYHINCMSGFNRPSSDSAGRLFLLLPACSCLNRPPGGTWQSLSASAPPGSCVTCPTCPALAPLLGHTSLSAPPLPETNPAPAAFLRNNLDTHVLSKQASVLWAQIGTGSEGAGDWHSCIGAVSLLKRIWEAGWLGCESVSSYIYRRQWSAARLHWMDRTWGQMRPTTLSLRVSACVDLIPRYMPAAFQVLVCNADLPLTLYFLVYY